MFITQILGLIGLGIIIWRIYDMPNEADLDAAIADLKTEISTTADRVLKKIDDLGKNNPDLTDEISDIRTDIESLKGIAPEEAPPAEG